MENRLDDTKVLKIYDTPRKPTCPFYGFEGILEINIKDIEKSRTVMVDKRGDQCALASIINMPDKINRPYCSMGKTNWNKCFLNTEKNRKKIEIILDKIRVFPKEHAKGISLRNWMYMVDSRSQK